MQEGGNGVSDSSAANREQSGPYEKLDPHEVEEARRRAEQPSEYAGIQVEDLYSIPKKNTEPETDLENT